MTKDEKEELERENHLLGKRCNQLLKDKGNLTDQIADIKANCDLAIEGRDVKIKELEEKISVLLSCKKCPENKGGYICKEEYDNKCLAQKIQYIKELQEENAELDMKRKAERKIFQGIVEKKNDQLTKAEEILQTVFDKWKEERWILQSEKEVKQIENLMNQAEQFLKEYMK